MHLFISTFTASSTRTLGGREPVDSTETGVCEKREDYNTIHLADTM